MPDFSDGMDRALRLGVPKDVVGRRGYERRSVDRVGDGHPSSDPQPMDSGFLEMVGGEHLGRLLIGEGRGLVGGVHGGLDNGSPVANTAQPLKGAYEEGLVPRGVFRVIDEAIAELLPNTHPLELLLVDVGQLPRRLVHQERAHVGAELPDADHDTHRPGNEDGPEIDGGLTRRPLGSDAVEEVLNLRV